ncbi:MAG: M3 family metallopeptidase [Nannocystis sp.]|nr:M3 family metallopeptidase [Nannocystis sp.]
MPRPAPRCTPGACYLRRVLESPLLQIPLRVPFDRISPEHIEPAITSLLAQARADLAAIVAEPGPRSYDNTLGALDRLTCALDLAMNVVGHLESVATTPALRAAHNAVQGPVAEFYAQIPLDPGLWQALRSYAASDDAKALQGARLRFLTRTLDDFRRHGAELPPAGKTRLAEIQVELSQATTTFAEHVLDATNSYEILLNDPAELAGLPASALAAARASAEARGLAGHRFTLQQPSLLAFLTYSERADLRERLYRAANICAEPGPHDNRELLAQILRLRHEEATLLGFADFPDFVLHNRMARRGATARDFVTTLRDKVTAAFLAENHDLQQFRRSLEGPDAPPLQPWDITYYAEKQRQALYDFDDEALRPYFPAPQALAGLFAVAGHLYGVRVAEVDDFPTWHPDVKTYRVDDEHGAVIGYFYADLYPRDDKRAGAWMNALITGEPDARGDFSPHLGLICANLTAPVGDAPALLTHDEVLTLFHEFGHLLHHLLTRVPVRSLAGTNVAWDFVELPSQILENWCWQRETLDLFAHHWQTGAPLPEELLARMLRARNFREANATMRQLGFAATDLGLHTGAPPPTGDEILARARELAAPFSATTLLPDHAMIARFTHLFAAPVAYAAGYYSYKWAEVLDADAFSRFQREGVLSRAVGEAFRAAILSQGDSREPADLFREFMGRDPDPDALLARAGLLPTT